MPKAKATNKNLGLKIGAGALAAAALAAAGGYVLWENMDKGKRAKLKTWAVKARKDAIREFARAKRMSEGDYKQIVDRVTSHYAALHHVNQAELAKTAANLKAEWKRIQKQAQAIAARRAGGAKKRKTVKRTAAKRK
ncbi:MAG TPA: hypothetical protein VMT81_02055 [Candidatus Paceibacterota bacterium]|nr:hypothetical protein [Candidatus Paceibacterota bacterium]